MAKRDERSSNKVVLVMLIAVIVLSVFSLSLYLSADNSRTQSDNEDLTPQLKTQGIASLTIEPSELTNEKEPQ